MATPSKHGQNPRGRRVVVKDGPDPIDIHVGRRLREGRVAKGVSQERIGHLVGISFQQVQKYESGANRISASKLLTFATVLGLSVTYFFEGVSTDKAPAKPAGDDPLTSRQFLNVTRDLQAIAHDPRALSMVGAMLSSLKQQIQPGA